MATHGHRRLNLAATDGCYGRNLPRREPKGERIPALTSGLDGVDLDHTVEEEGEEEAVGEGALAAADVNGAGPIQSGSSKTARRGRLGRDVGRCDQAHGQDEQCTTANLKTSPLAGVEQKEDGTDVAAAARGIELGNGTLGLRGVSGRA